MAPDFSVHTKQNNILQRSYIVSLCLKTAVFWLICSKQTVMVFKYRQFLKVINEVLQVEIPSKNNLFNKNNLDNKDKGSAVYFMWHWVKLIISLNYIYSSYWEGWSTWLDQTNPTLRTGETILLEAASLSVKHWESWKLCSCCSGK